MTKGALVLWLTLAGWETSYAAYYNQNCTQLTSSGASTNSFQQSACLATVPCYRNSSNIKTTATDGVSHCDVNTPVYGSVVPISLRKMDDKQMESTLLLEIMYFWYEPGVNNDADFVTHQSTMWQPHYVIANAVDEVKYTIDQTLEWMDSNTALGAKHFIQETVNMVSYARMKVVISNRLTDKVWSMNNYPMDSRHIQVFVCNHGQGASEIELYPLIMGSADKARYNCDSDQSCMPPATAATWRYTDVLGHKIPGSWEATDGKGYTLVSNPNAFAFEGGRSECLLMDMDISRKSYYIIVAKVFSLWFCEVAAFFSFVVPINIAMPRFAAW